MMTPHYTDDTVTLYHGDCLDVVALLPPASVDAVVTDPPYGLEFMGKDWDAPWRGEVLRDPASVGGFQDGNGGNPFSRSRVRYGVGDGFQAWCQQWAVECLRVLRPGGHLLAFGGTRTHHRLASAIEDAGFELRDTITWLYGSGFPKSLDVSKAIDKAAGAEREVIDERRQVVAFDKAGQGGGGWAAGLVRVTAPATGDAKRWAGWGTALKPAHEPIVVARKPLAAPSVNVVRVVENGLRERGVMGEIRWTNGPASGADRRAPRSSSSSIEQPQAEATSADPAGASGTAKSAKPTASGSVLSTLSGALPTPSGSPTIGANPIADSATPSSMPTAEHAPAAARATPTSSLSITSMAEEPRTVDQSTARSTAHFDDPGSRPDTESFAGIATGLTGSRAHVHIGRSPDGAFVWPDGLPAQTVGGSTVAANVLTHGTGALNVDACRVGDTDVDTRRPKGSSPGAFPHSDDAWVSHSDVGGSATGGRWPTNVVLSHAEACGLDCCADGCPVAELDRQSGHSQSFAGTRTLTRTETSGWRERGGSYTPGREWQAEGYADSGGASRFFPTFRYEPKAPASERPRVDGEVHETVKPLELMRWLVRLVTPPGGLVLDPFAGSGTTAEACVIEGFRCITIEREPDYLPLIVARLAKPLQPVLDFGDVA